MPPLFPSLPRRLGDYELSRVLLLREHSELYIATQCSVGRKVVLEILRPDAGEEQVQDFIQTARLRSSIELPNSNSVYETGNEGGYWQMAQELPAGESLAGLIQQKKHLNSAQICRIALGVARLYNSCRKQGLHTLYPVAHVIFLNNEGGIRCLSPVLYSRRPMAAAFSEIKALGSILAQLVPLDFEESAIRCRNLLLWMQNGDRGQALDWDNIEAGAALLLSQTGNSKRSQGQANNPKHAKRAENSGARQILCGIACALAGILLLGSTGLFFQERKAPKDDKPVYELQNSDLQPEAEPVSIREYAAFLNKLEQMDAAQLDKLNRDIPKAYRDHRPQDWDALYEAARSGGQWQGKKLKLKAPVRNVSYWDALAYARSRNSELASAEAVAAICSKIDSPLAEEWTADSNENCPLYSQDSVLVAYHKGPRPFINENNKGDRKPERGFRLMHNKNK